MLQQAVPATVLLHTPERRDADGTMHFETGAGSIIHHDGFVLTAAHVLNRNPQGYVLRNSGQTLLYRKYAVVEAYDLAIVRIQQAGDYPVLPLGRSDDLMLGEPVVAIGNPRGYGLTVSEGIISGLNRFARSDAASMRDMLQTSAPLNPGNSGGPLINAAGQQIGMALRGNDRSESLGLALGADRIRQVLPRLLAIGPRQGIATGLRVDPLADPPTVAEITAEGPAADLDLRVGDQIVAIDGETLGFSHSLDLALADRKPDQTVQLTVRRDTATHAVALTLGQHPSFEPVTDADTLRTGLQYTTYEFDQDSEIDSLDEAFELGQMVTSGVINSLSLDAVRPRGEYYAVRYEGFLRVPNEGVYALSLTSDDGSRLYLNDQLMIDNDGNHPALTEAAVVRLHSGAYPIRLEYFQGSGATSLVLAWQRDAGPLETVPSSALARREPQ